MSGGPGGHWVVITTQDALVRQANDALAAMTAANGGIDPPDLYAGHDADPAAFARLIEALVNLGCVVSPDLLAMAGIRPVGEILGEP